MASITKKKTRMSKVGAITKAQKAQNFFLNFFFISEKSRTMPKKIQRGDRLVSSGSVGYLKKVKYERGTLWNNFTLALGSFRSFSKSGPISVRSVV